MPSGDNEKLGVGAPVAVQGNDALAQDSANDGGSASLLAGKSDSALNGDVSRLSSILGGIVSVRRFFYLTRSEMHEVIKKENDWRHKRVSKESDKIKNNLDENQKNTVKLQSKLAALDLFVEKAIESLEIRAKNNAIMAAFSSVVFAIVIWIFLKKDDFYEQLKIADVVNDVWMFNSFQFTAYMVAKISVSTMFLAALYMSGSFARSFMHEATVLRNRINALRFGRLYVWLSDGKVDSKQIIKIFGNSLENTSSFLKIDPYLVTKGVASVPVPIIEAVAKLMRNKAPQEKPRKQSSGKQSSSDNTSEEGGE